MYNKWNRIKNRIWGDEDRLRIFCGIRKQRQRPQKRLKNVQKSYRRKCRFQMYRTIVGRIGRARMWISGNDNIFNGHYFTLETAAKQKYVIHDEHICQAQAKNNQELIRLETPVNFKHNWNSCVVTSWLPAIISISIYCAIDFSFSSSVSIVPRCLCECVCMCFAVWVSLSFVVQLLAIYCVFDTFLSSYFFFCYSLAWLNRVLFPLCMVIKHARQCGEQEVY